MQTILMDMTKGVDEAQMAQAGEIIRTGGLVAFPTETVYGLGGNALDPDASRKIYAAKGRPSDNPLIVHIADFEAIRKIVTDVPEQAEKLEKAFWPGPLTMILNKSSAVPLATTGGLNTVAMSPTKASHVMDDLSGKIDCVIDGGPVGIGVESTIVDLTEEEPVILRPGYINQHMLEAVLGTVHMDKGLIINDPGVHPKAPGMKYRHYAPKASLTIVRGDAARVETKINELVAADRAKGLRVGIIATRESRADYHQGIIRVVGTRAEEITISQHLFAILREFDDIGVDRIYSEAFDSEELGTAIMNRLVKAAGHQIIEV